MIKFEIGKEYDNSQFWQFEHFAYDLGNRKMIAIDGNLTIIADIPEVLKIGHVRIIKINTYKNKE